MVAPTTKWETRGCGEDLELVVAVGHTLNKQGEARNCGEEMGLTGYT